jgi:ornithine cyclodeaminase/alanine dehydrogenase
MAALYLTEADVTRLLNVELAIEVCAEAFRRLAAGEAENVPRSRAQAPGIILHSMSAAAGYLGLVGWKNYTTTRKRALFHLGLYDTTGALVALIEADRLGQVRTGAATGVAAGVMALQKPPKWVCLAGWQAQTQLRRSVRSIAYVYATSKRSEFASRINQLIEPGR